MREVSIYRLGVHPDGSRTRLYQNCTKTLCNCCFGAYFEREADSPKLLKTLKTEGKGWSLWSARTRLQSRCSLKLLAANRQSTGASSSCPSFYPGSTRSNYGIFGRPFETQAQYPHAFLIPKHFGLFPPRDITMPREQLLRENHVLGIARFRGEAHVPSSTQRTQAPE